MHDYCGETSRQFVEIVYKRRFISNVHTKRIFLSPTNFLLFMERKREISYLMFPSKMRNIDINPTHILDSFAESKSYKLVVELESIELTHYFRNN